MWGLLFASLVSLRALARAVGGAITPPERCLVLGDRADADLLEGQFELAPFVRARVVGFVPLRRATSSPRRTETASAASARMAPEAGFDCRREWTRSSSRRRSTGSSSPAHPAPSRAPTPCSRRFAGCGATASGVSLLPRGPRVAGPKVDLDQLPG